MTHQGNDEVNNPWNISNDKYYRVIPEALERLAAIGAKQEKGSRTIRHSVPASNIWRSFFPTYMSEERLRQFHRPKLKRFSRGRLSDNQPHGVKCLTRHIIRRHKALRDEVINSIKAGWTREEIIKKHLLVLSARKLTPKYGEIILFEYMEEHPPLLSQVGMASNIRNYFWPKASEQKFTPLELQETYEYGYSEIVKSCDKSLLGSMKPGRSLQVIANNMYKAPIFRHKMPECDFLIIRSRNSYYIRIVDTIFTVGQELPLIEVPCRNHNKFWSELWKLYVCKLFLRSEDKPKRLRHLELAKLFPYDSRNSVQRRLRRMAVFEPSSGYDGFWILLDKDNRGFPIRLPNIADLRRRLTPEQCCANYSMMAAEQRLRDAGYGNNMLQLLPRHENDEKSINDLEDEIKSAPWNTTRSFIAAQEGKCYLDIQSHTADPTGAVKEGFSFVRMPKYSSHPPLNGPNYQNTFQPTSNLTSHLDKTSTPLAKKPKTSHSPFPSFKNNQIYQARRKESLDRLAKFNKECQRIFELQNTVLSSTENLSSDDCSDYSEDELDKNLEEDDLDLKEILMENKSASDFNFDKEEKERIALKNSLINDRISNGKHSEHRDNLNRHQSTSSTQQTASPGKKRRFPNEDKGDRQLRIIRSYLDEDGKEYNRSEYVLRPAVIDMYLQEKNKQKECPSPKSKIHEAGDGPVTSVSCTSSGLKTKISVKRRRSLEEGELMKVEGTKCTFSKKVLDQTRRLRHGSRKNYYYGPA